MKNHGLNLELEKSHISVEDDIFGGFSLPCIADIPEDERRKYLPKGEIQRGVEDMSDCATRGPVNIAETKFNWLYKNDLILPENKKWLEDNGYLNNGDIEFSDAFIAIKSNTTRNGNSMKAPLQAIHDFGLIPKKRMPLESWMTFDDYHDKKRITPDLEKLGQDFKSIFPIRYERVFKIHFKELYKEDLIDLAGYAWPEPVNGEYPKVDYDPNHVFVGISNPTHTIFDNYIDEVDGDFIKKLASDYNLLNYGYRLYITSQNKFGTTYSIQELPNTSIGDVILNWVVRFINQLKNIFK